MERRSCNLFERRSGSLGITFYTEKQTVCPFAG